MRRGIGKQAAKNKIARDARKKRPPVILLDLRASRFDQLAVFDAGRTRGFARAAIQALVNVLDEGFAEREPALIHQHHLADAPARRIGFEAPEFIGRAMIQAQAAMDAPRVVFVRGFVRAGKSAAGFESVAACAPCVLAQSWNQIPPAKRPGLRTPFGSKAFFTRCINAKSCRAGPHTPPAAVFTSAGHHSSIADALISGLPHARNTSCDRLGQRCQRIRIAFLRQKRSVHNSRRTRERNEIERRFAAACRCSLARRPAIAVGKTPMRKIAAAARPPESAAGIRGCVPESERRFSVAERRKFVGARRCRPCGQVLAHNDPRLPAVQRRK